jgi:hypothetical protein
LPTTQNRHRSAWRLVLALSLAALLISTPGAPGLAHRRGSGEEDTRARGPWYTDLASHWAREYVWTLWAEGVTPPPPGSDSAETWTHAGPFRPDSNVSPSAFGDMLLRMFPGGAFPPPDLVAMALSGTTLPRQEAVRILIEALGLGPFARTFDPDAAALYLHPFHDADRVPPDYRQTMALAVFLGIIQGYPDHTLRPRQVMTRAEGAAVLFRSCLLLTEARPNPFSPDGDGAEDATMFFLGSLLNRNARDWDFFVLDTIGQVLRHLKPAGASGAPPASLAWAGQDDAGRVLPPGVYYYRGWIQDRNGLVHWSVTKPIVLEAKSLLGSAHPAVVLPGEIVELAAHATGGPSRVAVSLSSFPEAGVLPLAAVPAPGHDRGSTTRGPESMSSRRWEKSFTIPERAGPGLCTALFVAWYPGTTRTATATFTVGAFRVDGELLPNPVAAGQTVRIVAWPNLRPDSCRAVLALPLAPISVSLSYSGSRHGRPTWTGQVAIPAGTPPGRYAVTLLAKRHKLEATKNLWLDVTLSQGLVFILTD